MVRAEIAEFAERAEVGCAEGLQPVSANSAISARTNMEIGTVPIYRGVRIRAVMTPRMVRTSRWFHAGLVSMLRKVSRVACARPTGLK